MGEKTKRMNIIIIGIDHGFQRVRSMSAVFTLNQRLLTEMIHELISAENVSLFAEEYSQEALDKYGDSQTILQVLSKRYNIRHLFCDPNSEERALLRPIKPSESQYRAREEYWLSLLEGLNLAMSDRVVFLCGYDHLDTFAELCLMKGYVVAKRRI